VIFPKIGGAIATNKRRILVKGSAIDNNCLGIIPNENTDSEWLYYLLSNIDFSKYQSKGPVPSLRQSVIGKVDVPFMPKHTQKQVAVFLTWLREKSSGNSWDNSPSLPQELSEQKRIVAKIESLLERIEEARRLRAESVKEFEKLYRNVLAGVFSTEEFETVSLGKVCETTSGGTPSRSRADYFDGKIPWLKSGELNDSLITGSEEHITEEALQNSSAKIFPKGTLLIALYGATVGKTGILGIDASTNQAVCALFPKNNLLHRDYLHWFLKFKRNDFLKESFGGAQPNISQKLLRETKMPLPPLSIQRRIVAYLNSLQEKLEALKKLHAETEKEIEELIPSILNKAFKGEL